MDDESRSVSTVSCLVRDGVNSSVFSRFVNSASDEEERTASGKLFQTEVAAAENELSPMVARLVREMTSAVVGGIINRRSRTAGHPSTRVWANAQRDGRPAEHRWRPLSNAAKFG